MPKVYITGLGFIGRKLATKLGGYTAIPHTRIQGTDFSDATKVFFCSTYGNMSNHTDENDIIRANITDLVYTLSSINWNKIESFVFLSTSSVKLKVQTMYSRTKRMAEEILLAYMEKYNAPITIIRPMSVTGVGEQKSHLIPKLIDSCLNGTQMQFVEEPCHDFIDVEDIVDGILSLSNHRAKGIYELGTGQSVSNKKVRELVESVTGKKANVDIVNSLRGYDTTNWVSTNFKARGWGWIPRISLDDSIRRMVNVK